MKLDTITIPVRIESTTFAEGFVASTSGNVRAVVERNRRDGSPWRVWRVYSKRDGTLMLGGIDGFATFDACVDWLNNEAVWGKQ